MNEANIIRRRVNSENIQLVKLKTNEIISLGPVYKEVFEAAPWYEDWPLDIVLTNLNQVISYQSFYGIGLHLNGMLVGFAFGYDLLEREKLLPILSYSKFNINAKPFYLAEFGILPSYQLLGLGQVLLNHFSIEKKKIITRTKNNAMVKLLDRNYSSVNCIVQDFIDPIYDDRFWYDCKK